MPISIHAVETGPLPSSTPAPIVFGDGTGTLGIPPAMNVGVSPSTPPATPPCGAVDTEPVAAPSDARILSSSAIANSTASLPDVQSADNPPVSSSPIPAIVSSVDVPPSGFAASGDDGVSPVPLCDDSPANSASDESEHAGHPAVDAVPPIRPHSPSDDQPLPVRQMSSIGVQTVVVLTKRGKHVLDYPLLRVTHSDHGALS